MPAIADGVAGDLGGPRPAFLFLPKKMVTVREIEARHAFTTQPAFKSLGAKVLIGYRGYGDLSLTTWVPRRMV
jgi:hypothetical protein